MILKKLHIENFGKLHDLTIELNSGLNEFCYNNGVGKTSLTIFIKAMFYGMPPARENIKMERKKYMPWQGGNFGGYIEFQQEGVDYRLTRFFGKTPEGDSFELLNMKTNKIIDLNGRELGEVLFGVGRETFEMTAFFPQLNFSVISNEQISANILGLDKFKYDLANLNTAISQIKKKVTEVKREKPSKDELASIKRNIQEIKIEINELENRLEEIDKQIMCEKKIVIDCESNFQKEKDLLDFQKQKYDEKQKLKVELSDAQVELTYLLSNLNNLNRQNGQISSKSKNIKMSNYIALMILGILISVSGIILSSFKIIPVLAMVALLLISLISFGLGLKLYLCLKKKGQKTIVNQTIVELENKIVLKNQQIELIKSNLSIYQDIEEPNLFLLEQLNNVLYQERLKEQSLLYERENINQKIENLSERQDSLKEELASKEELYFATEKKIELLTKTKEFLMQANENVSSRFVGPANRAIKEVLTKFDMRNREFIVDTNFDVKEVTPIGVKEQEYSSQGYQDILAFCVRVYFLNEIYKQEKPFIILDDTFVNLDDENMQRARNIIDELKNNYQILYMCCNTRCRMERKN